MTTKKRRAARTPRPGRPPHRPGEQELFTIQAWVPDAMRAAAVERAQESGLLLAAWLREVIGRELGIDCAKKERPSWARLTDEQAVFAYTSPLGVSEVARRLNVSGSAVYAIRNGRTYKDATRGLVQPERRDYGEVERELEGGEG